MMHSLSRSKPAANTLSAIVYLKRSRQALLLIVVLLGAIGCLNPQESQMQTFLDRHVQTLEPLSTAMGRASYAAEVTGSQQDFNKVRQLRLQINRLYLNQQDYAFLREMKASGKVQDRRLARQLDLLLIDYLRSQMDPALLESTIQLQTRITEQYNNYRGSIDGKPTQMADIYHILTTEKDTALRKKAWQASREVGAVVVEDYLRLVRMRNTLAQGIGYPNFHTYSLAANEQSVEDLDVLLGELDRLTNEPFARLKSELDAILAQQYGIVSAELRPWHYHDPFVQRTPFVYETNMDQYYAGQDVVKLSADYFSGVGLPVDDIIARSDLYEKPGKNPHAFAMNIDRRGDVRILANVTSTERWMETMLHELGHAVYAKYHDMREPYLLRDPAHAFTTEAAAMFFGRLSRNAAWMQEMLSLTDLQRNQLQPVAFKYLQFQQILFARWVLVMYHFEKAVYADPDQDLNTLWWDLVERYQQVHRPDEKPDAGWASKLHFTGAPCYYHNYILGELLASQWHHYLVHDVLNSEASREVSFLTDPRIGEYFKKQVFGPGILYPWNEMIRRSTGEPLTPKYFAQQFVDGN
ncbi:MAG: M3 family oligoendopeptidase [Sedimentisphaerales bacterium]|nr:M3 family oligoendopeptidase [Sedimentisphaerales bacterium]